MHTTPVKNITRKARRAQAALVAANIATTIKKEGIIVKFFCNWAKEIHMVAFTEQDISRIVGKRYNGIISLQKMNSIYQFLTLYLQDLTPTPTEP